MTNMSFSRETLPKPMSRARQQVQQERRSAWVDLKGIPLPVQHLIKGYCQRGRVCQYCPHQRWETLTSSRLDSQSKATFPSTPLISEAAMDFSGGNELRFVFSNCYRKLAGIPSLHRKEALSFSSWCPDGGVRGVRDIQNLCRKGLPAPSRATWVPQYGPHEHTQKGAPSSLTHLGGCLSQVSCSFMATTKSFSSLLTFGLISC